MHVIKCVGKNIESEHFFWTVFDKHLNVSRHCEQVTMITMLNKSFALLRYELVKQLMLTYCNITYPESHKKLLGKHFKVSAELGFTIRNALSNCKYECSRQVYHKVHLEQLSADR